MYYVRLGGGTVEVENTDGTKSNVAGYIYDTFKFAVDAGGEDEKPKVLIGNANGDDAINALDLSEIAACIAKFESSLDNNAINTAAAAYCTGDDAVNALDLSEIAAYIAKFSTDYVGKIVDLGTYSTQLQ